MQGWSSKRLLLAWMLVGILLYVVAPNLPFIVLMMVGVFLLPAGLAHIGFGLFLIGLFVVRHGDEWRKRGLLIASPLLVFGGLIVVSDSLSRGIGLARFLIARPGYEATIAKLERGERPERLINGRRYGYDGARGYRIEPEGPLRIAFPIGEGIADNWAGVVYDPTDQVRRHKVDPKVRQWFGGSIVGCTHLTGHFYRCGFS